MKKNSNSSAPLSERMRPHALDEFVGQEELVGQGRLLRRLIEEDEITSLILWGPPGVGKTSLAAVIAEESKAVFRVLSGVMSGKDDLRKIIKEAEELKEKEGRKLVLFIDEIHRWNKAQQDTLLPYVEQGLVTLIGATTENPSFEIIGALLSRSRVLVLTALTPQSIVLLLKRALNDKERGLGHEEIDIHDETIEYLAQLSQGDARQALNGLEVAVHLKTKKVGTRPLLTKEDIKEAMQRTHLVFDKRGEEFYTLISALHKSMRGSDANAALYWLARMLEGGADPLYLARRIVRFASEDVGMANSEALVQAVAAYQACHFLGYPECSVHLAQAVVYCAKSAKSNMLYAAYNRAAADAKATSALPVPLHLRNASNAFLKEIGYGEGYKYNPDFSEPVEQEYLPSSLKGKNYFAK